MGKKRKNEHKQTKAFTDKKHFQFWFHQNCNNCANQVFTDEKGYATRCEYFFNLEKSIDSNFEVLNTILTAIRFNYNLAKLGCRFKSRNEIHIFRTIFNNFHIPQEKHRTNKNNGL